MWFRSSEMRAAQTTLRWMNRARPPFSHFKNACACRNADMNLLWRGIIAEPNRLTDSLHIDPFRARFLWLWHRKLCATQRRWCLRLYHFVPFYYYMPILDARHSLWDIDISVELTDIILVFSFESYHLSIDWIPDSIVSESEVRNTLMSWTILACRTVQRNKKPKNGCTDFRLIFVLIDENNELLLVGQMPASTKK